MARKDVDVDDVAAGRRYIAAYVSYVTFAEGEEHEHQGTGSPASTSTTQHARSSSAPAYPD